MYRLLLIDDDKEVLHINRDNFIDKGYAVHCMASAENCVPVIESLMPDCILLDVMMPRTDGFAACKAIRKATKAPIIFLSGVVSEDAKVKGLLLGADDYIEKPYSFRELEARVAANIRRHTSDEEMKLVFPPLELDIATHRALVEDVDLNLSKQDFNLLYLLANRAGDALTYSQIGEYLWGCYREEDRRTIMMAVSRLRKKMEHNPITARMIETVWAKGYRFVGK